MIIYNVVGYSNKIKIGTRCLIIFGVHSPFKFNPFFCLLVLPQSSKNRYPFSVCRTDPIRICLKGRESSYIYLNDLPRSRIRGAEIGNWNPCRTIWKGGRRGHPNEASWYPANGMQIVIDPPRDVGSISAKGLAPASFRKKQNSKEPKRSFRPILIP